MTAEPAASGPLGADEIRRFERDGFVRFDRAFSSEVAAECRRLLWQQTGCDPDDPTSWTRPVIRLGFSAAPPFVAAAATPRLRAAYDQLAGPGRWLTPRGLGTFPVRFPSPDDPGDAGWHVDASFGTDAADFMEWRINIRSTGRALLMLFLLSDTGPDDAPTRIRSGSHSKIARRLAPCGDAGLTLRELAADDFAQSGDCPEALAAGPAGTVYLCHPFLVHSAQPHGGRTPRFLAQPPLLPAPGCDAGLVEGLDTPVSRAIRNALEETA